MPQSAIRVFDAHVPPVSTARSKRSRFHRRSPPETNVLTDADGGHVHPAAVPPDTAIGTDVAGFEAIGTLESGQRRRQSVRMRRDQAHRDADDVEAGPHRTP